MMNELTTPQITEVEQIKGMTTEDILIEVLLNQKVFKTEHAVLAQDVDYLKNEQPVNPSVCLALEKKRKQKVVEVLGGKDSQSYRDRNFAQSVFSQAAKDFKNYFRIPRYDLLRRKDEAEAFNYWEAWEPAANTKMEIRNRNGQISLVG